MMLTTHSRWPLTPLRILLADDSVVHQKVTAALLQKQGHEVTITSNGKEAVDALESQNFDIVLMDVEMPVMNGLEATTAIRQRESWQGGHIPVVAVTSIPDVARCLAAGMDAHLPKPLQAEALSLTMQRFTPR